MPEVWARTHLDMLKQHSGICPDCYKKIYLVDQPVREVIWNHTDMVL